MSKRRQKLQEAVRGRYTPIPHELLDSQKFIGLSHIAKALLFDALRQHNGRNNGHIQLSEKWLKGRGWHSKGVIHKARCELVSSGVLSVTHAGGLNRGATLYGFTWLDVSDYRGLDVPVGQFVKGGWRDAATPLKTADAPASENCKEHPATRGSATPPRGAVNALTTPPHGPREGVFDHFTTPPHGDNETVASYPTFSGTSGAGGFKGLEGENQGEKEAKGASAAHGGLVGHDAERPDYALSNPPADDMSTDDNDLPADEPKATRWQRKPVREVESLPLPF